MEPCPWGLLTRILFNSRKLEIGYSLKLDFCIYRKTPRIDPWDKVFQKSLFGGFLSEEGCKNTSKTCFCRLPMLISISVDFW